MVGLILGVLFTIIFVVSFGWALYLISARKRSMGHVISLGKVLLGGSASAVALVALCFSYASFTITDATEVAVVTRFGELQGTVSTAGFHDKSPFDEYHVYSLKIQEINYDGREAEAVSFYSKDSQPVDAKLTVQWKVNAADAEKIYLNFGGEVQNVRDKIGALVIERTKATLSGFTAEQLISQRDSLSTSIEAFISQEISLRQFPVTIVAVYLTDFAFSKAFEDAVEAKMIAEQEVLKAENEKQKAIIQAEQELEVARINAEKAIATAEGEAQAAVLAAQAQADALKIQTLEVARMLGFEITSNSTGDEVVYDINFEGHSPEEIGLISQYVQYIKYLETWNGVLPTTLVGDGSGVLITVPSGS